MAGGKCCEGKQYFNRKQACCNGQVINKLKYSCCNNEITELAPGNFCCGDKTYPTADKTKRCCGGTTIFNPVEDGCCGTQVFSRVTHYCCGGKTGLQHGPSLEPLFHMIVFRSGFIKIGSKYAMLWRRC